MGKEQLVKFCAEGVQKFLSSSGKFVRNVKPTKISKDTIFAYRPNYDKALKSWENFYINDGFNSQVSKQLAKEQVNYSMTNFGRPLSSSVNSVVRRSSDPSLLKSSNLIIGSDASTYAMNITNKARATELAKYSETVAQRMRTRPELFALDAEEALNKKILDDAFKQVRPNTFTSLEYRGAALPKDSIPYKNLLKLKRGDIHTEAGYIWTSPNRGYAFGRYADATGGFRPQASIKYNILMPEGSKMLCVDRLNPETLLRYNSQFKVCNVKTAENGNVELFLEYLT